jgi:hypothetical protein
MIADPYPACLSVILPTSYLYCLIIQLAIRKLSNYTVYLVAGASSTRLVTN